MSYNIRVSELPPTVKQAERPLPREVPALRRASYGLQPVSEATQETGDRHTFWIYFRFDCMKHHYEEISYREEMIIISNFYQSVVSHKYHCLWIRKLSDCTKLFIYSN